MSATSRAEWKLYWLLFFVTVGLFLFGLVVFAFSGVDLRQRAEKAACERGDEVLWPEVLVDVGGDHGARVIGHGGQFYTISVEIHPFVGLTAVGHPHRSSFLANVPLSVPCDASSRPSSCCLRR